MARKLGQLPLAEKPPASAQEAMASLIDRDAFKNPAIRHRIDLVSYDGLPEPLVIFMRAMKSEMEAYGIPMTFMEGWRSVARQVVLRANGHSLAGPGSSPHQYGLAFDYVHSQRGWKLTHREWAQIGAIGHEVSRKRKIPIEWGGDWKFYDPAHWQIKGWRNIKSIMDALDFDESRRPDPDQWKTIILKADRSLYNRTWPMG